MRQNDVKSVKEKGAIVLEYLEPQYMEITITSDIVNDLIKGEKRARGLFDATLHTRANALVFDRQELTEVLLRLEYYAKSFERKCHSTSQHNEDTPNLRFRKQ